MPYSFGKDFTYYFYPLRDEIATDDFEDLTQVTDSPAIYVWHSETEPTRTEAAAGTNSDETISAWSATGDGRGKKFTIAAISDPDVTASDDKREYWIAINFTLKDSAQTQTLVRLLPMQRVKAHASNAEPTPENLNQIHTNLDRFFEAAEIDNAILIAKQNVKAALLGKGYEWSKIWNPDGLLWAIAYKALANLALGESSPGNSWEQKYITFESESEKLINTARILYDADEDGEPDQVVKTITTARLVR